MFNPENRFYMRQISSLTGKALVGIQREVENLETIGILDKIHDGNRVYYKVKKDCPIYKELKSIVLKTSGIAEVVKKQLIDSKSIQFAFIYGSYAKGDEKLTSDIDLMVVGDISSMELSSLLSEQKIKLQREINFTTISTAEFKEKLYRNNNFFTSIVQDKKIFLIGNEDEFREFTSKR
jgi:predicted nucleotidyltransferase